MLLRHRTPKLAVFQESKPDKNRMTMKTTDVSNRLDDLYSEVESVKGMAEEDVQKAYNVDSKDGILALNPNFFADFF